jgi:GT2 family glycosyltransferase
VTYVQSFLEQHSQSDRMGYEFIFVENSGDQNFHMAVKPLVDAGFEVKLLNSSNEGFGRGCNLGAKFSKGDLLIFVNPDIKFLSTLDKLLDSNFSVTWGTVKQVDVKGRTCSFDIFPEYKGLLFELFRFYRFVNKYPRYFLSSAYVVGAFMMVSRSIFIQSGGFDPKFFLYYEEAEFGRRLQSLSGPPVFYSVASVFHEGFGSHISREEIFKHEAKGFLTYCSVTSQPKLLHKRLRSLYLLGLVSQASKKRFYTLRNAALINGCHSEE